MFTYRKDGVDIQLKEEFMKELVLFVNTAKANKMDIPNWLEDSSKVYEKIMIKEELTDMVKKDGYKWFTDTVNNEEQKIIFEEVADKYVNRIYAGIPEMREAHKREALDSLLADAHYGFTTLRDEEEREV